VSSDGKVIVIITKIDNFVIAVIVIAIVIGLTVIVLVVIVFVTG